MYKNKIDYPLVSVNITTYNRAHILGRCLDSILKQSYKNTEIIIVDDFSKDNTQEIVKRYQKLDERIKYYRHSVNKGNAFTRNTALKHTTGKYVAFMDDDDEWIDVNKLKKQISIFEEDNDDKIGLVCSSVKIIKENSSYIKIIKRPKDIEVKILMGNSFIYNSTVLVSTKLIKEMKGFDEKLPRGIDSDFFRRLILSEKKDVYFMESLTSHIHEYGDDRITNFDSIESVKKDILGNEICLIKFSDDFKKKPKAKRYRKKNLYKKYIKLLFMEPRCNNFIRMIKGMSL